MCLQSLMNFHPCLFKILRKNKNVTDGRTNARMDDWTDGQRENSIPHTHIVCGGYQKQRKSIFAYPTGISVNPTGARNYRLTWGGGGGGGV